jgi:hypothetical protein
MNYKPVDIISIGKLEFYIEGYTVYFVHYGMKYKIVHADTKKQQIGKMKRLVTLIKNGDIDTIRKLYAEMDEDIYAKYSNYWRLPE